MGDDCDCDFDDGKYDRWLSAEASAVTLIQQLEALITSNANDPAAINALEEKLINALEEKLKSSADALAAAVTANTSV